MKRQKIGKYYVVRDKKGRFKRWIRIGRSLKIDRRKIAKRRVKSGYGHKGDLSIPYSKQIRRLIK